MNVTKPTVTLTTNGFDTKTRDHHEEEDDHHQHDSEILDPWCDPHNPRIIEFEQISAAAYRIRDGIVRTPCDRSHMSELTGMEIYFKKDFMQYTGSFKERGARYTLIMLDEEQKRKGVIAASAGNHALALAYHGGLLGIPVTVVMPVVAPIMKVENCKKFGANVIISGQNIGEARDEALIIGREQSLLYINGYDHPNIVAGQGTVALEILEQVPDVDAVVVSVGGGGLIAGMAKALKTMKPGVLIIGVEPERCPSFTNALKAGKPVLTKTDASLADGLTVPTVGINALATAGPLIDKMVTVSEEWIAISILRLVEMEKAVVEGGGASGVAAVLAGLLPELKNKKVVIPLCGGNIDTTILGRCLERGLAADGRLVKFTVTVSDRPGGIAELAKILCTCGVSIKDMVHERAWIRSDIFSVEIKVLAETRNRRHTQAMFRALEDHYAHLKVINVHEDDEEDFAQDEDGVYLHHQDPSSRDKIRIRGHSSTSSEGGGMISGVFSELALDELDDDDYSDEDSGLPGSRNNLQQDDTSKKGFKPISVSNSSGLNTVIIHQPMVKTTTPTPQRGGTTAPSATPNHSTSPQPTQQQQQQQQQHIHQQLQQQQQQKPSHSLAPPAMKARRGSITGTYT